MNYFANFFRLNDIFGEKKLWIGYWKENVLNLKILKNVLILLIQPKFNFISKKADKENEICHIYKFFHEVEELI